MATVLLTVVCTVLALAVAFGLMCLVDMSKPKVFKWKGWADTRKKEGWKWR